MLVTGFTLAVISTVGFYLVYKKLPRRVRRYMEKHSLMTDAVACLLTYCLFGGTLTALVAAAWMGIMVSILLELVNNPVTSKALEEFGKKVAAVKEKAVQSLADFLTKQQSQQPEEN